MYENYGERLQEERKRLGYTQIVFGEHCGAKKSTQVAYEGSKNKPDILYLSKAADLGCDINYIVTGKKIPLNIDDLEGKMRKKFNEAIFVAAQLNWLNLDKDANFDDLATLFIAYMKDKTLADFLKEKE